MTDGTRWAKANDNGPSRIAIIAPIVGGSVRMDQTQYILNSAGSHNVTFVDENQKVVATLGDKKVIDGDLVKVLSWYDNEFGYVSTLVKHVERIATILNP